jgi:hypothetical protein
MRGGSRGRGRGGRGGFNRTMRDHTQETPAIYKPREDFPVRFICGWTSVYLTRIAYRHAQAAKDIE